jgi:hypothetical protein
MIFINADDSYLGHHLDFLFPFFCFRILTLTLSSLWRFRSTWSSVLSSAGPYSFTSRTTCYPLCVAISWKLLSSAGVSCYQNNRKALHKTNHHGWGINMSLRLWEQASHQRMVPKAMKIETIRDQLIFMNIGLKGHIRIRNVYLMWNESNVLNQNQPSLGMSVWTVWINCSWVIESRTVSMQVWWIINHILQLEQ